MSEKKQFTLEELGQLPNHELIKTVRKLLDMNQAEFGGLLGYGVGAQERISELERQVRNPSKAVRKLCLIYAERRMV